jgi:hypothetical protein
MFLINNIKWYMFATKYVSSTQDVLLTENYYKTRYLPISIKKNTEKTE